MAKRLKVMKAEDIKWIEEFAVTVPCEEVHKPYHYTGKVRFYHQSSVHSQIHTWLQPPLN